jgi:predicted DNA-binding protein
MEPLTEATNKSLAFTFGRFNPPTIGHELLIKKIASLGMDYKIFLSRSYDPAKNPLSPTDKLKWLQTIFKYNASHIMIMPTNMILELATKIYNMGYTNITMIVGSDRVKEFDTILKNYNGEKNRHGYYKFTKINVVSAGERDPDEEGVSGMSASKLREYVKRGDFKNFKRGIPGNLSDKQLKDLFFDVRKGMGLSIRLAAEVETNNKLKTLKEFETQQVRDLYLREMIFNINEQAHNIKLDIKGKVVRRGTNYIVIEDTNNNLHKSWIWDCIPIAADREIEVREYNLNVDYGFQAVSEIKESIKMNDEKKEGYDIGHDWAQHTAKMTPGEPQYDPNYLKKQNTPEENMYKPSKPTENTTQISTQEIEDWSLAKDTLDKYRERYGDNYQSKIDEVKKKMISFKDFNKDKK